MIGSVEREGPDRDPSAAVGGGYGDVVAAMIDRLAHHTEVITLRDS
jgi:hypothetical protein